jgi:transcriptional regulator of met regulon
MTNRTVPISGMAGPTLAYWLARYLSTAAYGCHGKKSAQLSPIAVSVTHAHRQISE